MADNRTPNYNWPLPAAGNTLSFDVARIVAAFTAIDATLPQVVAAAITQLKDGAPAALDAFYEFAAALNNDPNYAATIAAQISALTTAVGLRATIASPIFTGDPKAPTPAVGDNDTSIATTAFVAAAITAAIGALGATYPSRSERAFISGDF